MGCAPRNLAPLRKCCPAVRQIADFVLPATSFLEHTDVQGAYGHYFVQQSNQAIGLFPVVLVMYTLISYLTDKWIYDRRQRKQSKSGGGKAPAR